MVEMGMKFSKPAPHLFLGVINRGNTIARCVSSIYGTLYRTIQTWIDF